MGKMSRNKGKAWEREVANRFKPIFGDTVKRGLAQARFGAAEEPDVKGVPRFWVECKHAILVNLRAALKQAEGALAASLDGQSKDRWPIAVCKDNRTDPVVVMRLDDFLVLVGEWWTAYGCQAHPSSQQTAAALADVVRAARSSPVPSTQQDPSAITTGPAYDAR